MSPLRCEETWEKPGTSGDVSHHNCTPQPPYRSAVAGVGSLPLTFRNSCVIPVACRPQEGSSFMGHEPKEVSPLRRTMIEERYKCTARAEHEREEPDRPPLFSLQARFSLTSHPPSARAVHLQFSQKFSLPSKRSQIEKFVKGRAVDIFK